MVIGNAFAFPAPLKLFGLGNLKKRCKMQTKHIDDRVVANKYEFRTSERQTSVKVTKEGHAIWYTQRPFLYDHN
jgi:hypothetical protein